ncbi:class I SAM-dependent methyltransferase [Ruegeria sediminis]|uniref:Class I SAM-dependent methyltransferase n=2 Tax=Ruegeria sediminis TaxID=2583820 RepID=A0ABY2X1Q7_9RHOB|nr:class I SAM-dependent methyltransferase [Ruegeria sediminis]
MDWESFFTLHRGLPREGPGCPDDVFWALERIGLYGELNVCDAGCGPGADLETLAEALPQAQLLGIESQPQFVEEAQARCGRFGDRVRVIEGDMADPGGPFDLIWCAGALYFLGVTEGLTAWRNALAPGGWVAFSEPVLLPGSQSAAAREFWEEYPALTEMEGITDRVSKAGYDVIDYRLIVGAPWATYYGPLRDRIAELRAQNPGVALCAVLDAHEREISLWEAARDQIAYALVLAQPA